MPVPCILQWYKSASLRGLCRNDEPVDRSEFVRWLAARLDAPEPPTLGPEQAALRNRTDSKRCRNTRLQESGYDFAYPTYKEGYADLITAFRSS